MSGNKNYRDELDITLSSGNKVNCVQFWSCGEEDGFPCNMIACKDENGELICEFKGEIPQDDSGIERFINLVEEKLENYF